MPLPSPTRRRQAQRNGDRWLYVATACIIVWVGSFELNYYFPLSDNLYMICNVLSELGSSAFGVTFVAWLLTKD